ncbi:MAG: UDP-N-acetylmuramate dehydrogenase [Bacilli bacterium]
MNEFIEQLKYKEVGSIIENVPAANYTTYKVGGIIRVLVKPKSIKELIIVLKLCQIYKIKKLILGNGSNLLFSDNLYNGIVIKLDYLDSLTVTGTKLVVGSGYPLMKLSLFASKKSLTGLEFAAGIPGTVGGAVYMNAGAYKSDMGYIVKSVKVLTPEYKVINMVNRELDFHYRTSYFKTHKDYIILDATLRLKKGNRVLIEEVMKERKLRRLESQPLEYPSAGSVFRNPDNLYAGKMIEDLGLKGLTKGGAQISNKHANFIINLGGAKATDIKDLIDLVKQAVLDNYNITLKVEQELINWEK